MSKQYIITRDSHGLNEDFVHRKTGRRQRSVTVWPLVDRVGGAGAGSQDFLRRTVMHVYFYKIIFEDKSIHIIFIFANLII
jgi:hypothetical protein